jgi:hypothetical protein
VGEENGRVARGGQTKCNGGGGGSVHNYGDCDIGGQNGACLCNDDVHTGDGDHLCPIAHLLSAALHHVCAQWHSNDKHLPVAELLVSRGADVNADNPATDGYD